MNNRAKRPTLKQLQSTRRKQTITVKDFLLSFGIKTNKDLFAYLKKNARKCESNYDVMVRSFGEANADKIMRRLEIIECHTDPKGWTGLE